MLAELAIENFAIIDHLLVRFEPGLTVLTGETGAGKSIIIDALQATLGARVAADVVRTDARFAAVEAIFDLSQAANGSAISAVLEEYGIEQDDTLILRREINASGRGAARVNGRAVPLGVLQSLGDLLVDVHGQSDHLSVLRRDRQLDAVDHYAGAVALRAQVMEAVREYNRLRRELDELIGGQREAEQRLDLLRFQVQEIESATLSPGEEDDLAAERSRLSNAERLTQLADAAYQTLHGEHVSALERVGEALAATRDLAGIDPEMSALDERLRAAEYELEDIAQELRQYRDTVEYDPERLNGVEERLDLLTRLRRKYGATVEEVIAFGEQARASLAEVENIDERIESLRTAVGEARDHAAELAGRLSNARCEASATLTAAMAEALQGLGLKGTAFEVRVARHESAEGVEIPGLSGRFQLSPSGIDTVTFLVSFNPGEPVRPLEKVASGGETSRFLLALKSVLALADQIPTLVFDEVDVGVGARNGAVVGERLRQLARSHQVLSITHLPQIAALADHHLTVAKAVRNEHTTVDARSLEGPDRVLEIAEMMTGTGSEAARRNAEELLEAAQRTP